MLGRMLLNCLGGSNYGVGGENGLAIGTYGNGMGAPEIWGRCQDLIDGLTSDVQGDGEDTEY